MTDDITPETFWGREIVRQYAAIAPRDLWRTECYMSQATFDLLIKIMPVPEIVLPEQLRILGLPIIIKDIEGIEFILRGAND